MLRVSFKLNRVTCLHRLAEYYHPGFIEFTLFFVMLFIYIYIELCTKMLTLE